MTATLKIHQRCPHRVTEEVVFLDTRNRRDVRFPRAPSNLQTVTLAVNGYSVLKDSPIYGYDFVVDPFRLPIDGLGAFMMIQFRKPLQDIDPVLVVSYTTRRHDCRRCHSRQVENDYRFNTLGRDLLVENEEKLLQAVHKWVFTIRTSNPFHPSIGSSVMVSIGGKIRNVSLLEMGIQREILSTLEVLRGLQQRQYRYQGSFVSDREILTRVRSVSFRQVPDVSVSLFDLEIFVENNQGQVVSVPIARRFRVDGIENELFGPLSTYERTELGGQFPDSSPFE